MAREHLPFKWRDDPDSNAQFPDGLTRTINPENNTITYEGWKVVNETDHLLPDVHVFLPWIAPLIQQGDEVTFVTMEWDNRQHGWTTPDFFGDSDGDRSVGLLVTLTIVPEDGGKTGYVAAGRISDRETGTHVFGPDSNSPGLPGFPTDVTLAPKDRLPFADLGAIGPNAAEPFDLIYEFHWSDNYDFDAYRVGSQPFSLVQASHDMPLY